MHGPGDSGYLQSITAIMGGEHHNLAIVSNGTLRARGSGGNGELGDGIFSNSNVPVKVMVAPASLLDLPLLQN